MVAREGGSGSLFVPAKKKAKKKKKT